MEIVSKYFTNTLPDNDLCQKCQLESDLTVSKEKEKEFSAYIENLLWTLNYVQYKTLEIYAKLKE